MAAKTSIKKQRVFLVVEPPHKPGQPVGVGNAVCTPGGGAGGGIGVEPLLIYRIAGNGKVRLFVNMAAKDETAGGHAAAEEVIGKQLVDQMRRPPGQRKRRVDDVAVYHDFSPGAEQPHHAADRRADLAGRVVVDDVVVAVGAQVGGQRPDAVLFMVRHGNDVYAVRLQCRGGAGLVGRALPHKQVDLITVCVKVEQQILHIPLDAALHAEVVADH